MIDAKYFQCALQADTVDTAWLLVNVRSIVYHTEQGSGKN